MSAGSDRDFVPCCLCSDAAIHTPAGFVSIPEYYCSKFGMPVDQLDGCTFGDPGEPMQGTRYPVTELGPYAAVHGSYYY